MREGGHRVSVSAEARKMILDALIADGDVSALVGTRIYDAPAPDAAYPFVSFGPVQIIEDDALCVRGFEIAQQVDIWSSQQGRMLEADRIVEAVIDVLHQGVLAIAAPYALVYGRVERAEVIPDPAAGIAHGIVTYTARIERV